jgi:hypothetical protein
MQSEQLCPLCRRAATDLNRDLGQEAIIVECSRCGRFKINCDAEIRSQWLTKIAFVCIHETCYNEGQTGGNCLVEH